jgi:TonB-linked SusC/RagA family outer membrane protein
MKKNFYTLTIHVLQLAALSLLFMALFGGAAVAQTTLTVKGKVTDAATKETVPGATVTVKGTKTAVAADVNGNYAITVSAPVTLQFSFIGYKTKEVLVTTQQVINVTLEESAEQLQDVVVTALGVTKQDREVGYSVSTVKGATLTEARTNSFVNGLEGKIAGVNVSGVATGPNGSTNVVIRGITSMTGSNQPLYVVDNIPLVNNNYNTTDLGGYGGRDGGDGIGDINPDDIETISVLKGAAATALYGYRGSNGVVLITTKKGKGGAGLGVEINSNYVAEKVIDETDFQTQYGQGNGGTAPLNKSDAMGSLESVWGGLLNGKEVYSFDGVKRPYSDVSQGNLSRFYTTGGDATNTISFTQGFDNGSATRFSFGDLADKSYVPNAGLQRMTFTQTTNLKLGKNLTLDLSSAYVTEYTKNAPNVADAVGNMNWEAMFLPPNVNILTLKGPNGNGTQADGEELNASNDAYTTNPYYSAYVLQEAEHRNRFTGSANLKYTFDSGYFIGFQVADDYTNDRTTEVEPPTAAYVVDEGIGGDQTEENVKQTELNLDLTTGKKFKVNKDLSIDLLLGANYRKSQQEYLTEYGTYFVLPNLYTVSNLEFPTDQYALNIEEYNSLYGSAEFSYKNYLYLTVTGRNDWYSTLAPGKINYLYPSISGSFVFSELLHIENMDLGKLRMSYANVGGAVDNPYQTLQTYGLQGTLGVSVNNNSYNYPIGYAGSTQVPNSGLVPSSRREFEVGTEMDFFKSRLTFDLSVYHKNVINDIVPVSIDNTSGYTTALLNVGNLRYNGIEVALGGTPVKLKDFSWQVNGNFAFAKGKVLSLGGQPNITLSSEASDNGANAFLEQVVGKEPLQIFAAYPETDANGKIIIDPTTDAPNPANFTYRDFGSAENPWSGGLDNTFRYKHFRFEFSIDGKFGGHIYSETNFWAYEVGLSKETLPRNESYGTDDVYASTYYANWGAADQGKFVYSDSFIKFRQLIFGYDFPASAFNNKIHGLNLSFVCRNVFTIFKAIPNVDPESSYSSEIQTQGFEAPSVPYSRTFGLNLKVTL